MKPLPRFLSGIGLACLITLVGWYRWNHEMVRVYDCRPVALAPLALVVSLVFLPLWWKWMGED